MENKHEIIKGLLADNKILLNTFTSIVNNVKGSKLLQDIIEFLDDDNVLSKNTSDKNKIALVSLMKKYYIACGDVFLVDSNLDKLIVSARQEIYNIQATSGIRIATSQEVENGVNGLVATEQFPIGQDKYKMLNLLMWTIEGRLGNYTQAGFKYNYDKDLGLIDTVYQMIVRSADSLTKMMEWVGNNREFNSDMALLKKAARHKYKYPDYAPDEIRVDITVKQLLFYLKNNLPRSSSNPKYREAISFIIKEQENKYFKLTPLNISALRNVYNELITGAATAYENKTGEDSRLKIECEQLIKGRELGLIKAEHFAFKIISTLQKSDYRQCTKKQYDIIKDALSKVNIEDEKIKEQERQDETPMIMDMDAEIAGASLLDISNALGNGNFEL